MSFIISVDTNQALDSVEIAKRVIEKEKDGIDALFNWVGEDFTKAIELIMSNKGRLILSGMGKSGHIAKKIAATLASTGTASYYVHPSEASHGDLGMIDKNDVVMLFSNSGETIELKDIINYCKRFRIPIISVVRKKTSLLVEASDIALILPDVKEVCDVNAPTTSTTMMLVLGDAIAVTLLEKRSFDSRDFKIYHPGGNIGRNILKVTDLMHTGEALPIIYYKRPMSEVLIEMSKKSFGCVALINEEGNMVGTITDGDLRRHISDNFTQILAENIMTKNPQIISSDSLASSALAMMQEKVVTALFIVDHNKPKGILHIHDILKAGVI